MARLILLSLVAVLMITGVVLHEQVHKLQFESIEGCEFLEIKYHPENILVLGNAATTLAYCTGVEDPDGMLLVMELQAYGVNSLVFLAVVFLVFRKKKVSE